MCKFKQEFYDFKIINNKMIVEKTVNFDVKKFEDFLKNIPYKGINMIKDTVVENTAIPSMIKVFYEMVFLNEIPTPETFFNRYIKKHFDIIDKQTVKIKNTSIILNLDGLKGRVYRTYPSLIRDYHFYMLCNNTEDFTAVKYSFLTDCNEGVDLLIKYKNTDFAVSLFVDTKRSNSFKRKKYSRHNYSNLKEVCVRINPFDKENYIGDYALYSQKHIQALLRDMNTIIEQNNVLQYI